jgi:hypothetical protein
LALSFWPLAFGSYQQSKKISPNKLLSDTTLFNLALLPWLSLLGSFAFCLGSFYLALFPWLSAFGSIRLKTNISVSFSRN